MSKSNNPQTPSPKGEFVRGIVDVTLRHMKGAKYSLSVKGGPAIESKTSYSDHEHKLPVFRNASYKCNIECDACDRLVAIKVKSARAINIQRIIIISVYLIPVIVNLLNLNIVEDYIVSEINNLLNLNIKDDSIATGIILGLLTGALIHHFLHFLRFFKGRVYLSGSRHKLYINYTKNKDKERYQQVPNMKSRIVSDLSSETIQKST